VAREGVDLSVGTRIPQMDEPIVAAGGQHPSIGADCDGQHVPHVPLGLVALRLLLSLLAPPLALALLGDLLPWRPAASPQTLARLHVVWKVAPHTSVSRSVDDSRFLPLQEIVSIASQCARTLNDCAVFGAGVGRLLVVRQRHASERQLVATDGSNARSGHCRIPTRNLQSIDPRHQTHISVCTETAHSMHTREHTAHSTHAPREPNGDGGVRRPQARPA
jgi:hypothetical protein